MNKKWSKKKKITVTIIIVAVVALVAAVLYIALKPEDPIETEIYQVQTGDITETVTKDDGSTEQVTYEDVDVLNIYPILFLCNKF